MTIDSKALEAAAKAYAEATGYYVEFHRGLSSASADKIRTGTEAAIRAYLSATSPSSLADANPKIGDTGTTAEGVEYVVVPKEASEAMMDAADAAYDEFERSEEGVWCGAASTYRAMTSPEALKGGV